MDEKEVRRRLKELYLTTPDLFDLVVFDEASQMTVWDSIGVIARGKHSPAR